jgi:hypothetical protein
VHDLELERVEVDAAHPHGRGAEVDRRDGGHRPVATAPVPRSAVTAAR